MLWLDGDATSGTDSTRRNALAIMMASTAKGIATEPRAMGAMEKVDAGSYRSDYSAASYSVLRLSAFGRLGSTRQSHRRIPVAT
jgi:hypothetical protein